MDFSDLISIIGSIASWGHYKRAGVEEKAEAPGSLITEDFGTSYKKVSRWNVTIP